jgi:glutamine cyclotransferase
VDVVVRELCPRIVRRFPHDADAFTQGLLWDGADIIESTGWYGRSDIRRVRLHDNHTVVRHPLLPTQFGEGIVACGDAVWQLTWRERVAIRRDLAKLHVTAEVPYDAEGWARVATARACGPATGRRC